MEKKARFIKAWQDKNPFNKRVWEWTYLLYEYRGHEYIIEKANNGYMDTPMWKKHQEEQDRIDRMIENEGKPMPEWKYEGSAQEGFDLFWEYVEGNIE